MSLFHPTGDGLTTSRSLLIGCVVLFVLLLAATTVTPAQAAYAAFLAVALLSAWIASRDALEGIAVERIHGPRIFEGDRVPVTLAVRQTTGLPQTLVVVEDQFFASLSIRQRHLIPMMNRKWEAHLHYTKEAERHRGLYLLGPVRLWTADPLGIFARDVELDCLTRLTVYPRAIPLPGYKFLGPRPWTGPTLEKADRIGYGEEILSVRPYHAGDPPTRIHWRTSIRRGHLHVIEQDACVQTEAAIFADLTRRSRFGTGAESTTEMAIGCATSILTEAADARHRISLTLVREEIEPFPAGSGLAHLRHLLDRLAVVAPGGDFDFWGEAEKKSAVLGSGSRAIFIAPGATTQAEQAVPLVRRLLLRGVVVDVVLLDDSAMARIWRDQFPPTIHAANSYGSLRSALEIAGARVLPLLRGEDASHLIQRSRN